VTERPTAAGEAREALSVSSTSPTLRGRRYVGPVEFTARHPARWSAPGPAWAASSFRLSGCVMTMLDC
jgi:hypothetical protein